MRIGIFGGSFNPIHVGHINLALNIRESAGLDAVWFVVSPQNPFKADQKLMPDEVRLAMVEAALADIEGLEPCDVEMQMPRPSYMANTLARLREMHPQHEFVLVIGADNWTRFDRWYKHDDILHHHNIVVYPRRGDDIDEASLPAGVTLVDTPLYDISSTEIRERLAEGKSIEGLVPPAVEQMCRENS